MSAESLENYARSALLTFGGLEDFKYVLPRLLELSLYERFFCELEITLGKMPISEFTQWPFDEQRAVVKVVQAAWKQAVDYQYPDSAGRILCGAAAFLDVTPMLNYADANMPIFRELYRDAGWSNAFWVTQSANYQKVLDWVFELDSTIGRRRLNY